MRKAWIILFAIVLGWSGGISVATLTNWPAVMQPYHWTALFLFFGPGLWTINQQLRAAQRKAAAKRHE